MMVRISMWGWLAFLLASYLLTATQTTAMAAPAQIVNGDVSIGQRLAQKWCSDCHAVGAQDTETHGEAPSFVSIADMSSTTSLSLHAFLQTPHERMPNLQLTQSQIDGVVAYILSLKSR